MSHAYDIKTAVNLAKFFQAVCQVAWELGGDSLDLLGDKALELGLVQETRYDPVTHGEDCYAEPGDRWYEITPEVLELLKEPPCA